MPRIELLGLFVRRLQVLALLGAMVACSGPNTHVSDTGASPAPESIELPEKPNILWLVAEDMSPIIAPYGDSTVATPNLTQLAKEGVVYTNTYSTSGVCAPSRAALALGMYPTAVGANHMRTTSYTDVTGLPKYEAVPPSSAKMLSQILREHGYYTTNNLKTDYQFKAPRAAWDESGPFAHWRDAPEGQPFYAVFNFTTTHESGLFEPYGFREIESRHYFSDDRKKIAALPQHHSVKTDEKNTPSHLSVNTSFQIPPYLPDTPVVRRDLWKMYNNLAEMDRQIGAILALLKRDGLYDNTIIVFYSDHGGPLPRQKRLVYDSGLKVPLIIRYPNAQNAGAENDRLISFVDFAPTTLSFAGIEVPTGMHGKSFSPAAKDEGESERKYIHAAADRFDGFTDTIRAVKNKRYKYIRNYQPEKGYYLPISYREKIPSMQELLRLRESGELDEIQMQWFRERKPREELYDTLIDPHELNNIAGESKYEAILQELSAEMDRWLVATNDQPGLPERNLIDGLWEGSSVQPATQKPSVDIRDGQVSITSPTRGATISYRLASDELAGWKLYQSPVDIKPGDKINVVAHRIGYRESEEISVHVE